MTIHFQLLDPSQMGNLYSAHAEKNQQLDANSVATQLDDLKEKTPKARDMRKNYQKAYVVIFLVYIYIYILCIFIFIYTWCFFCL